MVSKRAATKDKEESPSKKKAPTHDALVKRAAKWLETSQRCSLVIAHGCMAVHEMPDAIGWDSGLTTILVEVKMSRADFLKDRDKSFRKRPEYGMGQQRYYFVPKGIITPKDLPLGWGLVEVSGKSLRKVQSSGRFAKRNIPAEHRLLYTVACQQQRALTDLHRMWRKSGRA